MNNETDKKTLKINSDLYYFFKDHDYFGGSDWYDENLDEKGVINAIFYSGLNKDYKYEEVETLNFEYLNEDIKFDLKNFPKFPKLKHLSIACDIKNLGFLDYFPNLESINLYTQWLDPSTKLNIKKPLENLKEIIFTESDFWEIVLNNYKLFPNIESFNFNSFGEVGEKRVYINPNDLELFPKLQNVKLDQSSFYLFGNKK